MSSSPEVHGDDKTMDPIHEQEIFDGEFVAMFKNDGGNTGIKPISGVYARSHAQPTACPTFDYIKNVHYQAKKFLLNPDYHYFGENMYAIHSIEYAELTDYFYLFNILDTKTNEWLSWEELKAEAERVGYTLTPYLGVYNGMKASEVEKLFREVMESEEKKHKPLGADPEGFVVRKSGRIPAGEFSKSFAKYVRKGHVQTDEHWSKNWKKAELKK